MSGSTVNYGIGAFLAIPIILQCIPQSNCIRHEHKGELPCILDKK